ncbi:MAG: hypothetical protein AAGC49_04015, partial [Brevundimonas sp.]
SEPAVPELEVNMHRRPSAVRRCEQSNAGRRVGRLRVRRGVSARRASQLLLRDDPKRTENAGAN